MSKEKAPAANPPQNDFQYGKDASEVTDKDRAAVAKEVKERGTMSKYAVQHAGSPSERDREVEDDLS